MERSVNHIGRPFKGYDIENWRTSHGLSMDTAAYALGLANYKKKSSEPGPVEYSIELLMRLYDENPQHGVWPRDRITLPDLFNQMYGEALEKFAGTEYEVTARVDLQARFAKLLGRSKGRAYRWLDEKEVDASLNNRTQETIQAILGKLSQVKNPGAVLERLGSFVWITRGEDISITFPIPTPRNPPMRGKRGRKPGSKTKVAGPARRLIASHVKVKTIPKVVKPVAPTKAAKVKSRKKALHG